MTDSQIKSVSLFFFLTLLDEELTEKVSSAVNSEFRKTVEKNANTQVDHLVHLCSKNLEKYSADKTVYSPHLGRKGYFLLPTGFSIGAWRQFHKEAPREDMLAIVFSQVLGFEDEAIAKGLGISVGTVRYRVGRGLRQLGQLIALGEIGV